MRGASRAECMQASANISMATAMATRRRGDGDAVVAMATRQASWVTAAVAAELGLANPTNDSHVARFDDAGQELRQFTRAMTVSCLEALGRGRAAAESPISPTTTRPAHIVMLGPSNMYHVWHALGEDDSATWDAWTNARKRHPACKSTVPDYRLASFAPHEVDFAFWQTVTPGPTWGLAKGESPSCRQARALGGGRLRYLTNHSDPTREPPDAVVVHLGMWDASFTGRNVTVRAPRHRVRLLPHCHCTPQEDAQSDRAAVCGRGRRSATSWTRSCAIWSARGRPRSWS